MNRFALLLLSLFSLLSQSTFSQDFDFEWSIKPAFRPKLRLEINHDSANSELRLKLEDSLVLTLQDLEPSKVKELYRFLSDYSFPKRGSKKLQEPKRKYEQTILLPEDGLVVIGRDTLIQDLSAFIFAGDTFKLSPKSRAEIRFDSIKQQYYRIVQPVTIWCDGTYYSGKFTTSNKSQDFKLYYTRFTNQDLALIHLLLRFFDEPEAFYYRYISSNIKEIEIESEKD
mgnify:CR=1 FL=1